MKKCPLSLPYTKRIFIESETVSRDWLIRERSPSGKGQRLEVWGNDREGVKDVNYWTALCCAAGVEKGASDPFVSTTNSFPSRRGSRDPTTSSDVFLRSNRALLKQENRSRRAVNLAAPSRAASRTLQCRAECFRFVSREGEICIQRISRVGVYSNVYCNLSC